jgi:hypothetical protein
MYSIDELTQKEKDLKKSLRELGGLTELFGDIKENYQGQIDIIKKILRQQKIAEENKSARFGKGAKQKKEALAEIAELESKLSELSDSQKSLDEKIRLLPTISKERTDELTAMITNFKTEEIKALPFEELATCFLAGITKINELNAAEQKNDILTEKYNRQQKELHPVFIEKLKAAEEYFIAFSPATHAPYMDLREKSGQACLWLFTKEEYAKNCRNFFARQYIFIDVVKIDKKDFSEFAKNLPRWGFNFFTLNNGVHNLTVELSALIGKVQYSCPVNPSLHARRFDFFQSLLLYNKVPQTNHKLYEQYHNPMLMKAKESVMLHELYKAKYTLVMKVIKQKDENGQETETSEIPTNIKDDVRFLLVFTDMLEFNAWKNASDFKTDGPGFVAKAVDFATVDHMANETKSELLLDRSGWCFEFTAQRRAAAKQIAEQVEKLEAERKKKQTEK